MSGNPIAEAFGAEPELLPLLPELLADFGALGGCPDEIVAALRVADLPDKSVVIDLGCGKGAVSIAIARELGHRVSGIDLFEPFLREAVTAAREAGVADLCLFEEAEIRRVIRHTHAYDAAVLAAVGPGEFGDHAACVGAIRACVRSGGYMIIGDGFLRSPYGREARPPGYEHYECHEETIRQLTASGDVLVHEIVAPRESVFQRNREDLEKIAGRVRRLSRAHPEQRGRLERFLATQAVEYDFLNGATAEAIWLLRRA